MRFGARERGGRRCGDAYRTLSSFRLLQLFAIAMMLGSVSLSQRLTRAKTSEVGRRARESRTHRPRGKGGGARARESRTRPSRVGGGARGDARVARSSARARVRARRRVLEVERHQALAGVRERDDARVRQLRRLEDIQATTVRESRRHEPVERERARGGADGRAPTSPPGGSGSGGRCR